MRMLVERHTFYVEEECLPRTGSTRAWAVCAECSWCGDWHYGSDDEHADERWSVQGAREQAHADGHAHADAPEEYADEEEHQRRIDDRQPDVEERWEREYDFAHWRDDDDD